MPADYVYKNFNDTIRFRVFSYNEDNYGVSWNVDIFEKDGSIETYSECGDIFTSKKDAKAWIIETYGIVKSIQPNEEVTEGWF